MPRFTAIERAATLLRDPLCVARMRAEPLPSDTTILLRVLAREPEAEAQAAQAIGKPVETVHEAAEFYVTQVLFHSTSDAYRILGVRPDASREELRTNLALLLRWLHPDIAGPQHRGLTERVIKAWNDLKAPDARLALDESLAKAREKGRRRRAQISRRVEQRSRRRPAKTARKTGRRKKFAFAMVVAVLVVIGGVAYLPADTFAGASQLVSTLLDSVSTPPSSQEPTNGTRASETDVEDNRDAANPR